MSGAYYNDVDPFCCQWLRNLADAGHIGNGVIDGRSIKDVQGKDLVGFERCHFFAGIGGWDYALRLAGWPDNVPVWSGSCPCQPFSIAGKRQGEEDERDLWPEFFRLIWDCRPPVIFGEQVASTDVVGTQLEAAFIDAVQNGHYACANKLSKRLARSHSFHYWSRWIDRVQADLAQIGYAFRFAVLGAHSVTAPHIRQRVYWVAVSGHQYGPGLQRESGVGIETDCGSPCVAVVGSGDIDRVAQSERWTTERRRFDVGTETGAIESGAQERERIRLDAGAGRNAGWVGYANGGRGGQADTEQQGRNQTSTAWSDFSIIPCRDGKVRRVGCSVQPLAYGIPRDVGRVFPELRPLAKGARANRVGRLKGYGNAIVPQVAAAFVKSCMEIIGIVPEVW